MNNISIDKVTKFWDEQPCNIKHSNIDINENPYEYFEEIKKKRYFVENHIIDFAQFENWNGKNVLEIGCGIGTDAISFAQNGCNYYGIDLSQKSIDITIKRFNIYGLKYKSIIKMNVEDENELKKYFGNNIKFDLIYSFGVIHHSPNPKKIINNISNYIKTDGVLKIMLYAKNSWKKALIDGDLCSYEAQQGCPIAYTYTNDDVYNLLSNKFNNINIKQQFIFPYKIENYKKNIYIKEKWFEVMPKNIFNIISNAFGWHLCITCTPK